MCTFIKQASENILLKMMSNIVVPYFLSNSEDKSKQIVTGIWKREKYLQSNSDSGSIRSLHGSAICWESLDLAALWMKMLPNRSIMVQFHLLKPLTLQ